MQKVITILNLQKLKASTNIGLAKWRTKCFLKQM
jgi:hypothetical protein